MHAEKMSANWDQLMSPPSLNIMDEKVHMYLKTCIFLVEQRPHTCNPTASVVNFWCCHEKVDNKVVNHLELLDEHYFVLEFTYACLLQ